MIFYVVDWDWEGLVEYDGGLGRTGFVNGFVFRD